MNPNQATPGNIACAQCGIVNGHTANCLGNSLQSQVNAYNYYPAPSSISSGTAFSGFAQTTNTVTDTVCCLCGNKFTLKVFASPPFPLLCDSCEMSAKKKLIAIMVPEGSKEHCPRCHFHVNACACDEAKKMKQLEK